MNIYCEKRTPKISSDNNVCVSVNHVGGLTSYFLDHKAVLNINIDFLYVPVSLDFAKSTDIINKGCSIYITHVNLTSCELYRSMALRTSNFLAIRNLRALFHATGLAFCSLRF